MDSAKRRARSLEEDAYRLEKREGLKRYDINQKVSDAYVGVAEAYLTAGDPHRAKSNYKDALRHAEPEKKEGIEKKIQEVDKLKEKASLSQFRVSSFLSIAAFGGALIFVSTNLTGYAIKSSGYNLSNIIGGGLFLLGLVFAFIYFKKRK